MSDQIPLYAQNPFHNDLGNATSDEMFDRAQEQAAFPIKQEENPTHFDMQLSFDAAGQSEISEQANYPHVKAEEFGSSFQDHQVFKTEEVDPLTHDHRQFKIEQINTQPQSHVPVKQEQSDHIAESYPSLQELEKEAARLRELNAQLDALQQGSHKPDDAPKSEIDQKSVYVGNVDYGSTPLELQQHFASCGEIERVTIMTNKQTGHPKGFAYIEFSQPEDATNAVDLLNGSTFRDRQLRVNLKRTNIPGYNFIFRGGIRGRGRGRGLFRGRGRGGFRGRGFMGGISRFSPY